MDKNPDVLAGRQGRGRAHHPARRPTRSSTSSRSGYDWAYSFISDVEGTWGAASDHNTYWFPPGGVIAPDPEPTKAPFDDVERAPGHRARARPRGDRRRPRPRATWSRPARPASCCPNQEELPRPDIPDQGMITQDTDAALAAFAEAGYTLAGRQARRRRRQAARASRSRPPTATPTGSARCRRCSSQLGAPSASTVHDRSCRSPPATSSAISNGDFEMAMGGMGNGDRLPGASTTCSRASSTSRSARRPRTTSSGTATRRGRRAARGVQATTVDAARRRRSATSCRASSTTSCPCIGLYYGGLWGLFSDAKFTGWPERGRPVHDPADLRLDPAARSSRTARSAVKDGERPVNVHRSQKLGLFVLTLWAAVTLNFFLPRLMPGSPADAAIAKLAQNGPVTDATTRARSRPSSACRPATSGSSTSRTSHQVVTLDFGVSYTFYPQTVVELVVDRRCRTRSCLVGIVTIVAFVLGTLIGVARGLEARHLARHAADADGLVRSARSRTSGPRCCCCSSSATCCTGSRPPAPTAATTTPGFTWDFIGDALYHAVLPALTILRDARSAAGSSACATR